MGDFLLAALRISKRDYEREICLYSCMLWNSSKIIGSNNLTTNLLFMSLNAVKFKMGWQHYMTVVEEMLFFDELDSIAKARGSSIGDRGKQT